MTQPDIKNILKQARIAAGLGDYPQAIQLAQQVLQQDSQNPEAIERLGGSLAIFGKHHEAKRVYAQAIRMGIITPRVLGDYAGLLNQEGRHELALQTIERAAKQFPENSGVLTMRIEILATMSRHDEAYALLKPAMDANTVDYRTALAILRICKKVGKENEAIDISFHQLLGNTLSPAARMTLLFKLGLLLHDVDRYDEAFVAADEANRLRWRGFDAQAHATSIDMLIERWSPQTAKRMGTSGITDSTPVFIVGMMRSGTTLLEQVLNAHHDFLGIGERPYITDIVKHLQGQEFPTDVPHMHRAHLLNPGILKQAGEQYIRFLQRHDSQVPHVIDKRPDNFLHIGLIATMLPGAHILHCTRSFEDVAMSCFLHDFYGPYEWAYRLETIADYMADYERLMQHWDTLFPGRIHQVPYESVAQDLEPTIRAALDAMDVEWDDACLAFHTSTRIANTSSIDQVRQPVYTKAIGSSAHYDAHLDSFRKQLERRRATNAILPAGTPSNPERAS